MHVSMGPNLQLPSRSDPPLGPSLSFVAHATLGTADVPWEFSSVG